MNAKRRQKLNKLIERLEALKEELDTIKGEIEEEKDAEQEYYDSMPDSIRDGDKGTAAEEAVSSMQAAEDDFEEALSAIDVIMDNLTEAAN